MTEVLMRYNVIPDLYKGCAYVPKELTAEELAAQYVKRAAVGAIFNGHMDKLPTKNAHTLWEVKKSLAPPAEVRPMKPELWLKNHVELKANIYYKLD